MPVDVLPLGSPTGLFPQDAFPQDSLPPDNVPLIAESANYQGSFTLTNPHDVAVRITDMQSSCPCDELTLAKYFLLPHEQVDVTFSVTNDLSSGERRHDIWFLLSDPHLTALKHTLHWRVQPHIAVDLMPPSGPFHLRPQRSRQDIYQYMVQLKPNELERLNRADRKIIRLWSDEQHHLPEGLELWLDPETDPLWDFTLQRQSRFSWLLLAHRDEHKKAVEPGVYLHTLSVHSNHPDKPLINLMFHSHIDQRVGSQALVNPWQHLPR